MKILMVARSTLYSAPGGDTTQIEKTAEYLKKLGIDVIIKLSDEKIDYLQYDMFHFFNIIRPDDILPHIRTSQKKFIVSTIFVDYSEYEKKNRQGLLRLANKLLGGDNIEYIKSIARFVKNGEKIKSLFYVLHGHKRSIRYIAEKAAVLLPNSHSEYARFVKSYGIEKKYKKVVNAIDPAIFAYSANPDPTFTNHIICVGRIEGRKNQLNLIKALIDTELQLSLIGKPSPNHVGYYAACRAAAAGAKNIQFIEHVPHQQLPSIYKAAKVHVLPSWFETTGLSSLEAAAMGCNLVITDKGDTKEYFNDMAYYCAPDNVGSIRNAVLQAYHTPTNAKLQDFVLRQYTWNNAAAQTLEAYQSILQH